MKKLLLAQDAFGYPLQNYLMTHGSSYRSVPSGVCTLILRIFFLIYVTAHLINLFSSQPRSVSQFELTIGEEEQSGHLEYSELSVLNFFIFKLQHNGHVENLNQYQLERYINIKAFKVITNGGQI